MKTKSSKPKSQTRFPTVWAELDYVCRKVHHWLHDERDKRAAMRYRSRLQRVLDQTPANEFAILRAEGLSLLHELTGDMLAAIKYRKREIELMKRLQDSVRASVLAGKYDTEMARSILHNRDGTALRIRRSILNALQGRPRRRDDSRPSLPNGQGGLDS